jgi:hypothetical protein
MSAIPTNKKIAIIHDSLTDFGGAERVLFHLLSIFPQADVYTSLIQKISFTSSTATQAKFSTPF